jgi:hypothetical protein
VQLVISNLDPLFLEGFHVLRILCLLGENFILFLVLPCEYNNVVFMVAYSIV